MTASLQVMKACVTQSAGAYQAAPHRAAGATASPSPGPRRATILWSCLWHQPGGGLSASASNCPQHGPPPLPAFGDSTSYPPSTGQCRIGHSSCWPQQVRYQGAGRTSRPKRFFTALAAAADTASASSSTSPNSLSLSLASDTINESVLLQDEGDHPDYKMSASATLPNNPRHQQRQQHQNPFRNQTNAAALHGERPADASLLQRPVATRGPATAAVIEGGGSSGGRTHRPPPSLLPGTREVPSQHKQPRQGLQPGPATPPSGMPPWPWPSGTAQAAAGTSSTTSLANDSAALASTSGVASVRDGAGPAPGPGTGAGAGVIGSGMSGVHRSASSMPMTASQPGAIRGEAIAQPQQQMQTDKPAPSPLFSDSDPCVEAAYDGLSVTMTGRAPPAPLLSYNELTRAPRKMPNLLLSNAAAAFRLNRPTPIQSYVIPAMMDGRDVLAVSCTGSGKTLAYLLPLLAQLMGRNRVGSKTSASPEALVLVPTRELAEQVFADVQLLIRRSHLKALTVHGGVSLAEQVIAIRGRWRRSAGGVDLLVATPGRLLQLVEQRRAVRLGRLGLLVVDEADRMMEEGMWPDLRRLLSRPGLPTARQTVLVAASLPGPQLAAAAAELLRDSLAVSVGDGSGTSGVVWQHVELVADEDKLTRLTELLAPAASSGRVASRDGVTETHFATANTSSSSSLSATAAAAAAAVTASSKSGSSDAAGPTSPISPMKGSPRGGGPALVFTRSLQRAEEVARHLAGKGVSVALLHRDLTQDQRDEAMQCFRFGVTSVLVATALASRGLNFPDVEHVVNYDVPASASIYMHQVGRTGRGGRPGLATTLVTRSNRPSAPWLLESLRSAGSPVPSWLETMAQEARAKVAALRAAAAVVEGKSAGGARQSRRRTTVALDDPAAATTVKFGSYMTPPRALSGRQRSGTAGARGDAPVIGAVQQANGAAVAVSAAAAAAVNVAAAEGASLPPLQPVVLDRRHDAEYWQAVFDSALRPLGPLQAATAAVEADTVADELEQGKAPATGVRKRRGQQTAFRSVVRSNGRRPNGNESTAATAAAAAAHRSMSSSSSSTREKMTDGSVERRHPGSTPGRATHRLVYRDAAVEVEALPGGGLRAGLQTGRGRPGQSRL
ncbi:hypothetical protein VaNZ11_002107 [Volvox africanus]|uniref:DEAD/DEAH box helicase n=1 Tax=Volvox africanus TaxID=51714 RepID=A0ABQ5RR82_9CHLO|nr:hypothetical protein VaNZ11_002107 [Volvox africanus]